MSRRRCFKPLKLIKTIKTNTETAHHWLNAIDFPSPSLHVVITSGQHYKANPMLLYNHSDILKELTLKTNLFTLEKSVLLTVRIIILLTVNKGRALFY